MLFAFLPKFFFEMIFDDFNLVGKIFTLPLAVILAVIMLPLAILEFVAIDIFMVLFLKDYSFADLWEDFIL
jgi:hypothetical protein